MPSDPLPPIRAALKSGDKKTAQTLLRPLLKNQPSADVWYLAAQACPTDDKAIECLRRALDLEPQHSGANRLLFKLEGLPREEAPKVEIKREDLGDLKPVKRPRRGRGRRLIILLGILVLGSSCSLITMNLIGVISGPITALTTVLGGATPVKEIDGVPIDQVDDAAARIAPAESKPIAGNDANVLEPGYVHEYTFAGNRGQEYAIYVQFLSVGANRVSRNVVVLRPDGSDATSLCLTDAILQGDNNITLTCSLDVTGTWSVHILGREGESVGAYFVGVQPIQS